MNGIKWCAVQPGRGRGSSLKERERLLPKDGGEMCCTDKTIAVCTHCNSLEKDFSAQAVIFLNILALKGAI